MTHAAFLLASGNVRATTGQSKLKRVTLLKRCFTLLDSFVREGRPMDPPMRATHEQLKPLFTESK
jgi:hypothetical protein